MAETHVQRKSGPAPWVWLVVFLAILVVAWLAFAVVGRDERVGVAVPLSPVEPLPTAAAGAAATGAQPPEVQAFVDYVRQGGGEPGRDHRYTAEATRRLAAALQAMAAGAVAESDIRTQLSQMRQAADQLQAEPSSGKHAGMARRAFESASDAIARFAESHPGTKGHVAPLREAAQDLSADRPLLEQAAAVNQFFERAAEILTHLARERA